MLPPMIPIALLAAAVYGVRNEILRIQSRITLCACGLAPACGPLVIYIYISI